VVKRGKAARVLAVSAIASLLIGCGSADEGGNVVFSGGGYVNDQGHVSRAFDPAQQSSGKTQSGPLRDSSGREIVFMPDDR